MNTPESSPSGNIHGMPLACSIGIGPRELTHLGGYAPKIDPANVAIIGLRSVDEAERRHVRAAGVHAYTMRDLDERGLRSVIREAIERVTEHTAGFHLLSTWIRSTPARRPASARPCAAV